MNHAMNSTVETVNDLQRSLKSVDSLLKGIQHIVVQTNLLALHTAIEAARASEYGKGFAEVADEVRKLAEESAAITVNITTLTSTLFEKSTEAYDCSDKGGVALQQGELLLHDVSSFLVSWRDKHRINSWYGRVKYCHQTI